MEKAVNNSDGIINSMNIPPNFRYERKFTVEQAYKTELLYYIRRHPAQFREIYTSRQINNIYLDTPLLKFYVNNEIGNILDVERVSGLCNEYGALFHSDTVQSIGHFEWDLQKTPVDFLAAAAHKFHGPKGIGFAFIRKDSGLKPLIFGGAQERGFRAGTEAVHNVVGLEEAFRLAYSLMRSRAISLTRFLVLDLVRSHWPEPNLVSLGWWPSLPVYLCSL